MRVACVVLAATATAMAVAVAIGGCARPARLPAPSVVHVSIDDLPPSQSARLSVGHEAFHVRDDRTGATRRVTALELLPRAARGASGASGSAASTFVKAAILSGDGKTVVVSVGTDLPPPPPGPGVMRWTRARYDLVLYAIATGRARHLDSLDTFEMLADRRQPSHHTGFVAIAVSGTGGLVAYCRNVQTPVADPSLSTPKGIWEFRLIDTATRRAQLVTDPALASPRCFGHALSPDGTVLFVVSRLVPTPDSR